MEILTRMDKIVIVDYYHMTTMNENVNCMKLIYLLSTFSLNLKAPFVNITLPQIY